MDATASPGVPWGTIRSQTASGIPIARAVVVSRMVQNRIGDLPGRGARLSRTRRGPSFRRGIPDQSPPVHARTRTGFANPHLAEEWKFRCDSLPDPSGQHFAGRILEAFDLVQASMVKCFFNRLDGGLDRAEVHEIAGLLGHVSLDDDVDVKGVPVEPATLVVFRKRGQPVGCFESKRLAQRDPHE